MSACPDVFGRVIDFRDRRALSAYEIARRRARVAEHQRLPPGTRCRAVGSAHEVTTTAPPDALGNHPVRLVLADGRTRDFQLPAISLSVIEDAP